MDKNLIKQNLLPIVKKIESLKSKYKRNNIQLVAVSKTKPTSLIKDAYALDQRHFGENYIQELVDKSFELEEELPDIKWHYIGSIQTNKIKLLATVKNLYMVESVSSKKIAKELNKRVLQPIKVLVQINTSNEESKSGILPKNRDEYIDLVSFIMKDCDKLEFKGLMTIGLSQDVDCFKILNKIKQDIIKEFKIHEEKDNDDDIGFQLSMGMSNDYELAIEHGATNVRVGSSIFGKRDYSKKKKNLKKLLSIKFLQRQFYFSVCKLV